MRAFGSVLSFEVSGGREAASRLLDRLRLVRPAVSLGGPETLVCHPASSTHVGMSPDTQRESGITESLLRVSVGLEAIDDVIADFSAALA
jgi:cystathionine beta-lyase/cystathionine gamma-synthase